MHVLYFEVISCETGVINLEHKASVVHYLIKDLDIKKIIKKMLFIQKTI